MYPPLGSRRIGYLIALWLCFVVALLVYPGTSPASLTSAAQTEPIEAPAKFPRHVIILIGDGMGYYHVDAASLYQYGQTGQQIYEQFPYQFGMSTYSVGRSYDPLQAWTSFNYVKSGPTDSAAAATAMATGQKTYNGSIGMATDRLTPLQNILQHAEAQDKRTGVVSSVQFSHATPAAFVAHNASRHNYAAIANEMILNSAVDVIMGAGHPEYNNKGDRLTTPAYGYVGGESTWQGLQAGTAGGDADGDGIPDPWTLIETQPQFQQLITATQPFSRVIGVPRVRSTLQYYRTGDVHAAPYVEPFTPDIPSLEEMTRAALRVLADDPDGFVLMVEGGAIDWASHANRSGRMVEEMIAFNAAVEAVVDWVDAYSTWDETVVIVTGDHETGYLTGPGSGPATDPDTTPIWHHLVNESAGTLPGMQWNSGGHTNSLIPFYARGGAARFFETYATRQDPVRGRFLENTAIAQMLFALGPASDPPAAQFDQTHYTIDEHQPTATLSVTLDAASDTFATLTYATIDGTASAGSDYTTASRMLTFAPGVLSQTITISLTDDLLDEPDETLVVVLGDTSNVTLTSTFSTTLTIRDDDRPTATPTPTATSTATATATATPTSTRTPDRPAQTSIPTTTSTPTPTAVQPDTPTPTAAQLDIPTPTAIQPGEPGRVITTDDGSVQVIIPPAYDSDRLQVVLHLLKLPATILPADSIMPIFYLEIIDTQTGMPVTEFDSPITIVIRPERSTAAMHLFYQDEQPTYPTRWHLAAEAVQRTAVPGSSHSLVAIELRSLPGTTFVLVQPIQQNSEQVQVYLPLVRR